MADGTIDSLNIQISSDANRAIQAIDSLQKKLGELNSALNGLGIGGLSSLSSGVAQLSHAMSAFKAGEIKTADFTRIATGLNKLSTVNVQGVSDASRSISTLTSNLSELRTISFDSSGIENIASAIAKLGRASVTEATQNLEFLKSSVAEFVSGMNGIGSLNFGTDNLYKLVSSVSRLGSKTATQSVKNLPQISTYLRDFVTSMNSVGSVTFNFDGLEKLVGNISRLGGVKATQSVKNLEPIKSQLLRFIDGLNGIGSLKFDMTGLNELVGAISRLGGKAAGNAIPHIEGLGVALKQLMATLSTAPVVSQNLIDMTNALANLAKEGSKVGSATKTMQSGFANLGKSSKAALKSTKSLVSKIGMFYARFFLLIRGIKELVKAAKSAMDYVETLNYFNAAFRQVASKADVSDWEKYGYKSAEAYANSFEARSKQLTQKLTGFTVSDEGDLSRTGMPSLGLDPNKVLQYQATFAQMASSMGVASEQSLKLSNALTMIGADLASVRNMEFEDVWRDMASGMVGMSRTLDKYGVNIRNVNLQQELYNLGINKSIAKLNQQDKAVLRTIVLLNSTRYAWGDLANTINQPANSLRLLQSNFASLARTIGSLFIPVITKVLPYISALVIALQKLFAWIGGLLGVKLSGFTSSVGGAAVEMGDFADSADDAAGGLGDANKEAKKLKGNLQSFDELNTISVDTESGGGGGAGGGIGGIPELSAALDSALAEYQKAWDAAYANMENRANELADKVIFAFIRIWEAAEPTREALKRLWNEGLSQLGNFTWSALKDFWKEFLIPIGNWSLGTGLPMLIDAVNNFLTAINWSAINESLRNFWQALEPFAERVGEGLILFFNDLLQVGAKFINFTVPNSLNSISEALKNIDPKTAENIGYGLGILAGGLMAFKTLAPTVKVLTSIQKSMKNWSELKTTFKWLGGVKYLAIAAGIGGIILALDKFGYIKVNWDTLSKALGKVAKALGKFAVGIGKGLISFVDKLLDVLSPTLEGLINGLAGALDGLGGILNAIPEGVIAGIAETLLTFFMAFKTYKVVIKAGGLISTLTNNLKLFAGVLPGIVNSGPILKNLASALGPSALGGIKFTLIAGGLFTLAMAFKKFYDNATDNPELEAWAGEFNKSLDKINNKSEEISGNLDQLKKDYFESSEAQSKVAESLAEKYATLHEKANPTAEDISLMKQYSEDLVNYYPELEKYFNDESGLLEANKKDIQDVIDKQKEMARIKGSLSSLEEAYRQQAEAQRLEAEAAKDQQIALENYNKAKSEMDQYYKTAGDNSLVSILSGKNKDILGIEAQKRRDALDITKKALDQANSTFEEAKNTTLKATETINFFEDEYEKLAQKVYDSTPEIINSFEEVGACISENLARKLYDASSETLEAVKTMFSQLQAGTLQSGEQLKAVFDGLGIEIPNAFMEALENQADAVSQSRMAQILLNLGSGAQQTSESLKTIFHSVGLELPDSIISGLAEKEGPIQQSTVTLLGNIESGAALTEKELFDVFSGLGLDLSDELASALANGGSDVQKYTIQLLSRIESGEKIKEQDLIDLFTELGVNLPEEFHKSISSKNAETQKKIIELLDRVFTGERLKAPELTKLFSGLGLDIPNELIQSLESKNDETQKQAIELIGQIYTATDDERGPLLEKLNALGIEGVDNLNSGLGSKDDETIKTVKGMANTVKDTAKTELDPSARGSGSLYEIGKNTGEGFLSGLQASWGSVKTWVGGAMKDFKNKITGTDGLDINSPSKVMKKFGVFAIEGFNIGLSNEMQDTYLSLDKWITNMKKVDIPEFTTGYEINRSIYDKLDFQYHSPEINTKGIDTQISLADLIDYDRLGKAVYEAQNRAMQENPMVIGDEAIYRSWHRSQKSNYYGTNKLSLSGI